MEKMEQKPAITTMSALKKMFSNEQVAKNLHAMLGEKAQGFCTSVLSVVNNSRLLQSANAKSIYSSAMIAASLDLPVTPSLGFAALVPYKGECQFQIMTKGIIQLAIRSAQYAKITNAPVYEGQLIKQDPFTDTYEFSYDTKKSDKVIGYMAYFKLNGGFEKYFYMTCEEAQRHGKRYSKSYSTPAGLWATDFNAMALKTVLKLLLSKYGILSIEMQRAIKFDQAAIASDINSVEDIDNADIEYIDNANAGLEESEEGKAKAKALAEKFKNFGESQGEKEETVMKLKSEIAHEPIKVPNKTSSEASSPLKKDVEKKDDKLFG